MSQIRTAKASDVGAFPGSRFVVDHTPPIAQCQESQLSGNNGITLAGQAFLTEAGAFAGVDLAGKQVTVLGPPPNSGLKTILSNTDDTIIVDSPYNAEDNNNGWTVQNTGQVYLTRNESSFQRFIESQSKAHTTKGGQLYTDLPDPPMDDACSDTWNPQ